MNAPNRDRFGCNRRPADKENFLKLYVQLFALVWLTLIGCRATLRRIEVLSLQHGIKARGWVVFTVEEREAIREQVDRLLVSSTFRHGKRCPKLLRYIVEYALDGNTEGM